MKWTTLEHKGPYFAPLYECLPDDVPFIYDGKPYPLSEAAEEVTTYNVNIAVVYLHNVKPLKITDGRHCNDVGVCHRWPLSLLRCSIMIILRKMFL